MCLSRTIMHRCLWVTCDCNTHQHNAPGGHGTPRNDTAALECFDTALQLGQWRAPYALALMHALGRGTPVNVTAAQSMLRMFYLEQGDWTEHLEEAVSALDAGG